MSGQPRTRQARRLHLSISIYLRERGPATFDELAARFGYGFDELPKTARAARNMAARLVARDPRIEEHDGQLRWHS